MTSPVSDERLAELKAKATSTPHSTVRIEQRVALSIVTELLSRRSLDTAGGVEAAVAQYLASMHAAHAPDENGQGYVETGSYFSTLANLPAFVAAALSRPSQNAEVGVRKRVWTSPAEREAVKAGEAAAFAYSKTGGGSIGVFLEGLRAYRSALTPPAVTAGDAEPVAWLHNPTGIIRQDRPAVGMGLHEDYTPLYAAAPLPQVDEGMIERALNRWFIAEDISDCTDEMKAEWRKDMLAALLAALNQPGGE